MALKPKVARIYLNEEASELTKQAAQEIGDLSESQIVSLLVLAGLRALKETGFKLTPALEAWLDLGGVLRGMREQTVRQVIARSGVPWSSNVTRHSFVSYHLAQWENAGRTALESGHSETILFRHYRALVTPAAAGEFWAIRPQGTSS